MHPTFKRTDFVGTLRDQVMQQLNGGKKPKEEKAPAGHGGNHDMY